MADKLPKFKKYKINDKKKSLRDYRKNQKVDKRAFIKEEKRENNDSTERD